MLGFGKEDDVGRRRLRWAARATATERLDPDERFVLQRTATWLGRILARQPELDLAAAEVATWLLGPELAALRKHLAARAERPGRQEMVEILADWRADPSDYPVAVVRYLGRWPER